jgi:hypothetical protein
MLLKYQANVSPFRPMPVDDKGSSSAIVTVTGETVQFYYSNSGVLTADAGQAAGVLVVGQFAFNNIKNALGNFEASKNDTSLSFTSTAFTSEVLVDWETFENMDETTFANRLSTICSGFSNGQYVVDYSNGTIYGKKASTQTTLTSATYKYQSSSASSAAIVPGTGATNLGKAEDAAHTSGDVGVMSLAVANEAQSNISGTDGDYTPIGTNRKGTVYVAETLAPVYEDNTLGKAVVEHRYTNGRVTADGQIKASAGFLHKVTFAATGTVTAGVITIYDSLTETGTIIWSGTIQVATAPVTIHLNVPTGTGIYVGYDASIANVSTTVAYR